MFRSLVLVSSLLALLFTGCPSMSVAPGFTESRLKLEIIHSARLFEAGIQFLSFSEDGNTFVAGGIYDGVGLFRVDDYALQERYYERSNTDIPTANIISTGYFDTNTWYFTVAIRPPRSGYELVVEQGVTHVRTIQPSREIAQFESNAPTVVAANKNYFAYNHYQGGTLVDWRTGKDYPVQVAQGAYLATLELTHSNRVLSLGGIKNIATVILDDPLHQQTQTLEGYVTFSPDERYVVDRNGFRCKLLKFTGKEVEPLGKQKVVGYCGVRTGETYKTTVFSPDSKMFAIWMNRNVRVYRTEPFQLLFEKNTRGSVANVALSDTGWLAAVDRFGFLYAWDIPTGQFVGQYRVYSDSRFPDSGEDGNPNFSMLLTIQPGGNKLLTNYNGLTIFKLPERSTPSQP
jgi:WD40 repeat protein